MPGLIIGLVLIGIILIWLGVSFFGGYLIWRNTVPTKDPSTYKVESSEDPIENEFIKFIEKETKVLENVPMEDVWIKSEDGLNLHAYYREASSKTTKTIISVHGWHGSALGTAPQFSHWLINFNYNILFIDLRSYGKSQGKYTGYGVLDSKDLMKWIDYIIDRLDGEADIALFGISMGGNTVLSVADKVPIQVKCIIDDCGFISPWEEFKHVLTTQLHVPVYFLYFANIINKLVAHYDFKDNNTLDILKKSRVPVLFIHGTKDDFVPTSHTTENHEACTSEKEIHLFERVPHARSYFENKEEYRKIVLNFLAKRL